MYRDARKQAGLTQEEASFRICIGLRSLCKYEAGEVVPGPDVVLKMSEVYNRPEMTSRYCREFCPIGMVYDYETLNAIDTTPMAVLTKLEEELLEALKAIEKCRKVFLNKGSRGDFSPEEWQTVIDNSLEFLDIQHVVDVYKLVVERYTPKNSFVAELTAQHNQKCWDRGYVRKEKEPLQAAR